MIDANMHITRRRFVEAAACTGAAALAATSVAVADEVEGAQYEIAETRDVDVVVVGSGNAGVAAAVAASDEGASVLLLEKLSITGGNGNYTYGPSGFDTKWSKAAGVEYDYREAVIEDQHMFNYIPNIHYYIDMATNSAANLEWVEAHGVPISSVVDNYKGGNPTAHYWGEHGGEIDPVNGRQGSGTIYISGMIAAAEANGCEVLTETPAVDLVMDGARVAGVIARRADGTYMQVNAKATILATGGFAADRDLMSRVGRKDEVVSVYTFCSGCTGDGYKLAMKAGAFDTLSNVGFIEQPAFAEMGLAENKAMEQGLSAEYYPNENDEHPVWQILKMGKCVWVNEQGERFAAEDVANPDGGVAGWATNAFVSQRKSFAVIDAAIMAELGDACMDLMRSANEYGTKFEGETLEELAGNMGVPYEALKATVDRYNELCDAGEDSDFGKASDLLVKIGDGPYFATQLGTSPLCSIGGVRVNRQMQACDIDWNPIEGLYVIGVDSFPFYTQMYYFQLPGSAVAFELHSGIVAAQHAVANMA